MTMRCEKSVRTDTNKQMLSGFKAPDQNASEQGYRIPAENIVDVLWTIICLARTFQQAYSSRLFDRFYRGHQSCSGGVHHIGLPVVRRIDERYGVRIWARDSSSSGASVWFTPVHGNDR